MKVVAGCDGGGTKCEMMLAILDDDGSIVREHRAITGPANVRSNSEQALNNILAGIQMSRSAAGLDSEHGIDVFVAALAGAGDKRIREQWERDLAAYLPSCRIKVLPDAAILFAAGDVDESTVPQPAVAMIVGTGSIAWARQSDGSVCRAGGLGPKVGDEGSGYWLANQAIRAAENDAWLREQLLAEFELSSIAKLRAAIAKEDLSTHRIAQAAKFVFESSSEMAKSILSDGADHICRILLDATSGIATSAALKLTWICAGGVAVHQPAWLADIQRRCRKQMLHLSNPITVPNPVRGAVHIAARL